VTPWIILSSTEEQKAGGQPPCVRASHRNAGPIARGRPEAPRAQPHLLLLNRPFAVPGPLLWRNVVNAFTLALLMAGAAVRGMPVMWWQVVAFTVAGACWCLLSWRG